MNARLIPGAYYVNRNDGAGFPTGAYQWGVLLVFNARFQVEGETLVQVYVANSAQELYVRSKYWGADWVSWRKLQTVGV